MKIAAEFPFNDPQGRIRSQYSNEVAEVERIIDSIDSAQCRTKESYEKTMPGKQLYSPRELNKRFKEAFESLGWKNKKVPCEYGTDYYKGDFTPKIRPQRGFREIDFVKNRVGVEVQFGKYAFMVYNICAKMTIFHNLNIIDVGIEIVPIKEMADEMSTGVSFFEQIVWDLEQRGVANIDIPVLIFGVTM